MICRFIDTHCHFDFPPFSGDEEASLQRAAQAGVGKIIVPATEAHPAKVVAVGEIGLDLFGDDPQFERQQWLLDEQLKLAKRYDLPVILHSRRTHDKLAMHLKRHDLPCTGVVHG
ncbi:MAG: TatD family hydrolase, partial [Escherichia coli]|nr:TatD family hydrolase [Escherichia coli]